ncbi:MAG: hypothetical protein ACYTF6_10610 [Planctomycetota bacterium]|jgi:transcriptional regulator with XRE-family HTH domain
MELGQKLRHLLNRERYDYKSLADEVGCSYSNVRKIIDAGSEPKFRLGVRMARLLGVPPTWLADDEADWPPPENEQQRTIDLMRNALTRAGLAGELTKVERQLLALWRSLPEERRQNAMGYMVGLVETSE